MQNQANKKVKVINKKLNKTTIETLIHRLLNSLVVEC